MDGAALPAGPGYEELRGVPARVLEELRDLRTAALDGEISAGAWVRRHAELLAPFPSVRADDLDRTARSVRLALDEVGQDFERFLFLTALLADLRLLQRPDAAREVRDLAEQLPTAAGEQRGRLLRQIGVLRGRDAEARRAYDPTGRMAQALRVGTLEETYRWLSAAVAENPGASVQDLLTRAALEVAEAKLELDRYDDLNSRAG
jgi:hypothetical protein